MPYDPVIHHRRSIRLNGYDYSQNGAYFVTICVQEKAHLFGAVRDGEVQLNDAGAMIEHWWAILRDKFPSVTTDAFVVMPNHVHGIIIIDNNVGACNAGACTAGEHAGSPATRCPHGVRADQRVRPTLGAIMQWFKTMTTNAYIRGVRAHDWAPFDRRLWQRNYYERIIRNDNDLNAIREYIVSNPARWQHK